jgi:hypothetical protein
MMSLLGGLSRSGHSADENYVIINGGTLVNVVGGASNTGSNPSSSANGNHVTINGGKITLVVYGGCNYANGTANNNEVNYSGVLNSRTSTSISRPMP